MIEFFIGAYLVMFMVALFAFRETKLKAYYMDRGEKFKDYMKVLGYAIAWPVFLSILIYALVGWRK